MAEHLDSDLSTLRSYVERGRGGGRSGGMTVLGCSAGFRSVEVGRCFLGSVGLVPGGCW